MNGNLGHCYALTISPPDRTTGPHSKIEHIYYDDKIELYKYIKRCCSLFIIYPETDKVGRLHYHGTVTVNDKIKWIKQVLPRLKRLGFVCVKEIKTIKDKINWMFYCKKEWFFSARILDITDPIIPHKQNKKITPIADPSNHFLDYGFKI